MKNYRITILFLVLLPGLLSTGCSSSDSGSVSNTEMSTALSPDDNDSVDANSIDTETTDTEPGATVSTDPDSIDTESENSASSDICSASPRVATNTRPYLGNLYRLETANDERFHQLWNQVTPEYGGKWDTLEAQRDTMVWTPLDNAANFSNDFDYTFLLHTLISGNSEPNWISSLSNEEQLAEIIEWMDELAARYPDVANIDVVSNPISAPPSFIDALGGEGETGWDWIIQAFELADARFPNSQLFLNSANVQPDDPATSTFVAIANTLKDRGLIDGIGIEGHYFEDVEAAGIKTKLDLLDTTGIPLYVASLDLDIADDQQQLDKMKAIFPVFYDHESVEGITLWGYRENQLWRQNAFLLSADEINRPALDWLECYVGL